MSLTDLGRLHNCLVSLKLNYTIGEPTKADGSCFLHALIQNINFFHQLGMWKKEIPSSVLELRGKIIQYMRDEKREFVGFTDPNGRFVHGPLTEELFENLIEDQSRASAHADEDGYFVSSACKYLDVELVVVIDSITSPILRSGMGGPVQKINSSPERIKFSVGLLRDEGRRDGHYQFIYENIEGSEALLDESIPEATPSMNPQTAAAASLVSPVKLRRSRVVVNYIKSPSPKKKYKETHCLFCALNLSTAESLETHLHQSPQCSNCYLNNFRMKTLDPILVSKFGCFFCPSDVNIRISYHLKRSDVCKEKYLQRFKVDNTEALMALLENLRRKMRNSRSRASRNLENKKRKEGRVNNEPSTVANKYEMVNKFRQENTFFNTNLCCYCKKNIIRGEVLNREDINLDAVGSANINEVRRFETFFQCKQCIAGEKINENGRVPMQPLFGNGRVLLVPADNVEQQASFEIEIEDQPVTCLFPVTLEALDSCRQLSSMKSRSEDCGIMYQFDPNIMKILSVAYENEINKYKYSKMFSDRYQGKVIDGEDKLLSTVERMPNDHKIPGSDSWHNVENEKARHKMEQFGTLCCYIKVALPIQDDVIASAIIQSGVVVSVVHRQLSSSEITNEYMVHNHSHDVDCNSDACVKVPLHSYLPGILNLANMKNKFLTTHLIGVQTKIQSMVKHFLKTSSSDIYSEDFTIEVRYAVDGSIALEGFAWLKEFEKINLQIANYPVHAVDPDLKSNAIKHIGATISSSSKSSDLQSQFQMSEQESTQLAEVVRKVQHHYCGNKECKKCSNPRLPALETDFTESPPQEFSQNISTSSRLRTIMLSKLKKTTETSLNSMTTEEWLTSVFQSFDCVIIEGNLRKWKVNVGSEILYMFIDEKLQVLTQKYPDPLLGIYQYSLTCHSLEASFKVVIKTIQLCDCFTKPYHVGLLKAFGSEMEIIPVNGFCKLEDGHRNTSSQDLNEEEEQIDTAIRMSHREISLAEAFSSLDKSINRTYNSTSSEYICTYPERKQCFKKVNEESEECFRVEGKEEYFEKMNSNIQKYFGRRNGYHVTLVEFCMQYDYCGAEESRQLLKLFSKNPDISIKDSEVTCAFDSKKKLPELILTTAGEVMKIREHKKVISYPKMDHSEKYYKYSKVLMYMPTKSEITKEEEVNQFYFKLDDPEKNENNGITIVERIERSLFPKKNFSIDHY